MKKLLLISLAFAFPAIAMQQPKRKRRDASKCQIDYNDQSRIAPFRILALDRNSENVVGYINFGLDEYNSDFGHIDWLHVNKTYRGKGIGYKLFEKAIFALKDTGFKVITWDIVGLEDVSTEELKQIYSSYISKLKDELKFNFITHPTETVNGFKVIPAQLMLSDKR
ncbi:MAG: hypothetical protein AMXMBFR12_00480 [Candidatus Babeliales bacterium]